MAVVVSAGALVASKSHPQPITAANGTTATPAQLATSRTGDDATQQLLGQAADSLSKVFASDAQYDFVAFDLPGHTLVVYRAGTLTKDQESVYTSAQLPLGISLRFKESLLSEKERAKIIELWTSHEPELARLGVHTTTIEEAPPGGPLNIGFDPDFAAPNSSLLTEWGLQNPGQDHVRFVAVLPVHFGPGHF